MRSAFRLLARIARPSVEDIVESGLCIGCGLCQSVAGRERLELRMTPEGVERPHVLAPLDARTQARIRAVCPGLKVRLQAPARAPAGVARDLVWGDARRIVRGHAADAQVRYLGATGGVLTALAVHLLETGQVDFVLHVRASEAVPTRSRAHVSRTREDVIAAAGSRYGPAAPLVDLMELLDRGERFAFVGKPCDVAAIRNLARVDPRVTERIPYVLTLVCGGASELGLTTDLLGEHGLAESDVRLLRYRGHGCPGMTRVEGHDGRTFEKTYNELWGEDDSTWRLQFRCKICPDSIGEQADVVALDTWPGGSPKGEDDGFNAIIARSTRGASLLRSAQAAGALALQEELGFGDLDRLQPHQVRRRLAVAPRVLALALVNRIAPRFTGFRLVRAAARAGLRAGVRELRGTPARARRGREHVRVAR